MKQKKKKPLLVLLYFSYENDIASLNITNEDHILKNQLLLSYITYSTTLLHVSPRENCQTV